MPLPPKGDPRRPLHLAVRSTRMLGILFVCAGMCGMIPMFLSLARVRGAGGPPMYFMPWMLVAIFMIYFFPGIAYLMVSFFLKQRRYWAIIVALVLASIQCLVTLAGFLIVLITSFSAALSGPPGSAAQPIFMALPIFILGFIVAALAQLIYHLAKSFEAIKYAPIEEQHGFEPIMPPPQSPPNT